MCRHLAADLSGTTLATWQTAGERIVAPEYAEVNVTTESGNKASCYYEYEAVEESALEHADPLAAYANLPYRMRLDGEPVAGQQLSQAVMAVQLKTGKKVIEETEKGLQRAGEQVREAYDKATGNSPPAEPKAY